MREADRFASNRLLMSVQRRDVVWFYSQLRLNNLVLGDMTSFEVVVKQLPVEVVFHFGRYLGFGRETTPGESARHTIVHSEVESKGSVTDGSRQDFPALELGPGCLVLGINGAVRLTCRLASKG